MKPRPPQSSLKCVLKYPGNLKRALFLSYPKSGRTWIRFLIDSYVARLNALDIPNVFAAEKHPEGPPVWWSHLTGTFKFNLGYVLLGSFDWECLEGRRCLFMTRNFYATLASAYHHVTKNKMFKGDSPGEFLRDSCFGAVKLVSFYNLWQEIRRTVPASHVISYEDLKEDTPHVLQGVLSFLNVPIDPDILKKTVEGTSFARLRELSVTPAYANTPLYGDVSNPNSFKMRRGSNLDYKSLFTNEEIDYIRSVIELLLIDPEGELRRQIVEPAVA